MGILNVGANIIYKMKFSGIKEHEQVWKNNFVQKYKDMRNLEKKRE